MKNKGRTGKGGGTGRGRKISRLEEQLWKVAVQDVLPCSYVSQDTLVDPDPLNDHSPKSHMQAQEAPVFMRTEIHAGIYGPVDGHSILRGNAGGVDGRTAQKLARGQMPIDARLDLHGMRYEQAHHALLKFIDRAYAGGQRCVLVITGRGSRNETDPELWYEPISGILRRHLPLWLSEPVVAAKIIAVEQAQQRHGGQGAFYILLRRHRV